MSRCRGCNAILTQDDDWDDAMCGDCLGAVNVSESDEGALLDSMDELEDVVDDGC